MRRSILLLQAFCLFVLFVGEAFSNPSVASEGVRAWDTGVNGVDWGDDISKHPRMELQVTKGEKQMYTRRDFLTLDREHKERVLYFFTNGKFSGVITYPLDKSGKYQQELKALIEDVWGEAVPLEKLDPSKSGGFGWPVKDTVVVLLAQGNAITIRNETYD